MLFQRIGLSLRSRARPARSDVDRGVVARRTEAVAALFRSQEKPVAASLNRAAWAQMARLPLFDEPFYRSQSPDLAPYGGDPYRHYLEFGERNGFLPNPLFDPTYYASQLDEPTAAAPGACLLRHYLDIGNRQGLNPHPLFDSTHYLSQIPEVRTQGFEPLGHFLSEWNRHGANPHPLFSMAFYLDNNPDIVEAEANPLVHFVLHGAAEFRASHALFDTRYYLKHVPPFQGNALIRFLGSPAEADPHRLFDVSFYLDENPDVERSGINPLIHFLQFGEQEGRDPHPLFSVGAYRRLYSDVPSGANTLEHYLSVGKAESREPHPLFDPLYYAKTYPDVAALGKPVEFEHYLDFGAAEGRWPHPLFDPEFYREKAGLANGTNPLEHYVRFGGRTGPHPLFDGEFYAGNDPDLKTARGGVLRHYAEIGASEHRDPHPLFQTAHYLRQTDDLTALTDPLRHFLRFGLAAGLSPHPLFDPDFYRSQPERRSWNGALLPDQGPTISVIMPVFNTPPAILEAAIASVRNQTYLTWELCICDDASTAPETLAVLERYKGTDTRIKMVRAPRNLHIAGATNLAAEQATGEFLAFLDHDDTIEPEALSEFALAASRSPDADLMYSDEDKLNPAGEHCDPFLKPDWSPEYLHAAMYVLHLLVVRKSLFQQVGGCRPERTGAQDYDLALRLAGLARRVHHIPRILYHWRMVPGSGAGELDAKPYGQLAAGRAIQDAVAAAGREAVVEPGLIPGSHRVRYSLAHRPPVTLLILTNDVSREIPGRGTINLPRNFIRSIAEKSTYGNYRLLVVDNGNASAETSRLVREAGGKIVSWSYTPPFNYPRKANFSLGHVETENFILLNDDLEVISSDWIEALLEFSQWPEIGAVGARLIFADETVQHAGVILGINDYPAHAFYRFRRDMIGYYGYTHVIRNYSAVTGAVFATRREVMNEVGGFDDRLRIDFNDIDLCLRIGQTGRRIVYTPFSELYHFEQASVEKQEPDPADVATFRRRWSALLEHDPHYNPNLPRDRYDFFGVASPFVPAVRNQP